MIQAMRALSPDQKPCAVRQKRCVNDLSLSFSSWAEELARP